MERLGFVCSAQWAALQILFQITVFVRDVDAKNRVFAKVMLLFLFSTVSPYEGTVSNLWKMCAFAESFCASAVSCVLAF